MYTFQLYILTFLQMASYTVSDLILGILELTSCYRTVQVRREGPGAGFGFTLSGSSPVFIKTVDRGKL